MQPLCRNNHCWHLQPCTYFFKSPANIFFESADFEVHLSPTGVKFQDVLESFAAWPSFCVLNHMSMCGHLCVCIYIHMTCICIYICMYVCLSICLSVCMYACMYVCTVCMYVYMYVCMYVCMYMHACMHVCIESYMSLSRACKTTLSPPLPPDCPHS